MKWKNIWMNQKSDFLSYSLDYDKDFLKRLKKIKKHNPKLFLRLKEKMKEISENPHHYKPLKGVLKGKRRVHIGSFVIIFTIDEDEKSVIFLEFDHHDKVYG